MGRLTLYPFGSTWKTQGLGLTGFYDYGYNNTSPDNGSINTGFGPNSSAFGHVATAHLTRWAALVHYTAEQWGIAAEYDQGHNSFPGASLFSGNGPSVFFTPPATASTTGGTTQSVRGAVLQLLRDDGRAVRQQPHRAAWLRCVRPCAHPVHAVSR